MKQNTLRCVLSTNGAQNDKLNSCKQHCTLQRIFFLANPIRVAMYRTARPCLFTLCCVFKLLFVSVYLDLSYYHLYSTEPRLHQTNPLIFLGLRLTLLTCQRLLVCLLTVSRVLYIRALVEKLLENSLLLRLGTSVKEL